MGRPTNAERAARAARAEAERLQMEAPKKPMQKDAEPPQLGRLRTLQNEEVSGQKWKVKIFSDSADRAGFVDLAVNGHNLRIKRGEEVIIDDAYVEVLRNAVVTTFEQDPNTNERREIQRMAYPFQATPIREPQAA